MRGLLTCLEGRSAVRKKFLLNPLKPDILHLCPTMLDKWMSTLENAAAVLRLLQEGDAEEISVTEVHRALGMPKSTAGRLLHHMRQVGFLDAAGTGPRYRLGALVFELARRDQERHSLAALAEAALSEICRKTGHTGYVSTLSGTDIVVLRSQVGTRALQVVTPLGMRMPAAETAIGRAMLAQLSASELRRLYKEWASPTSPNSPSNFEELVTRLQRVRELGYAESLDEAVPNVGSTAVAVVERRGSGMIGVCVSYAASHVDAREREQLGRTIQMAVDGVAESTGRIHPATGRGRSAARPMSEKVGE